jgi:hypothetical protein
MTTLKRGPLAKERPVKPTVELPATVHRDPVAYGEVLARETGEQQAIEPARLIAPMLSRASWRPIADSESSGAAHKIWSLAERLRQPSTSAFEAR